MKYKDKILILFSPTGIKIIVARLTVRNKIDNHYLNRYNVECFTREEKLNKNVKIILKKIFDELDQRFELVNYDIHILFKAYRTTFSTELYDFKIDEGPVGQGFVDSILQNIETEEKGKSLKSLFSYIIDSRPVNNPVGRQGGKLSLCKSTFHFEKGFINSLKNVIEGFDIKPIEYSSIYAQALNYLFDEKSARKGKLLIDFGTKYTYVIAIKKNLIKSLFVIPLGGYNITKDLATAFNLDMKTAEQIKINNGYAMKYKPDKKNINIYDNDISKIVIPSLAVNKVIHARISEILDLIINELHDYDIALDFEDGIYITGNGSKLKFLTNLLRRKFTLNVFFLSDLIKSKVIYNKQSLVKHKNELLISYLISELHSNFVVKNKNIFNRRVINKWLQLTFDDFFS